ncbi:hypothetical protein TNCV_1453631 [Trichonephila clavipes]|nr:hypothetical protein TNCV_1453631 [Trichonephila clavipes]
MVGRHIFAQYVDEHYPVDKLGDLIVIGVKISSTYPSCQSAFSKDDRVSQEIDTVTPCEIAVCRSTINAGSDRWPVRLQTRVRWSSAPRLNRDSSLKMTRLQSVTEVGKKSIDTVYNVGSVVKASSDVGSSSQLRFVSFMVSLDGTRCLEGGKWR